MLSTKCLITLEIFMRYDLTVDINGWVNADLVGHISNCKVLKFRKPNHCLLLKIVVCLSAAYVPSVLFRWLMFTLDSFSYSGHFKAAAFVCL